MPIHLGKDSKGNFAQWGHRTKYYYTPNNKQSLKRAKSKAQKQAAAIFANGYIGQEIENISINIFIQKIEDFSEQNKNLLLKGFNTSAQASHQELYTLEKLNQILSQENFIFFFIKNNLEVIGTITFYISDSTINLKDYSIFPEFQGQGFGDKSFEKILQYCKTSYPQKIISFAVVCDNDKALNLYFKHNAKVTNKFDINGVEYYSMEIKNNILKQSKFEKIFANIMLQNYNPQTTKIEICRSNLSDFICEYYEEYYKTNPNNRQKFKIGYNQNGNDILRQAESPSEMLCQDANNFVFSRMDFERYRNGNDRYFFFVCLDQGYLIGLLKYWHNNGTNKLPTVGYIDINKNFKNQKYGIALIDKCFQYHAQYYKSTPLLLTEYSEEGQAYIKHVCQRLAQKYGIEIFMFDDFRRIGNKIKYGYDKDYVPTYKPSEKIISLIKQNKN